MDLHGRATVPTETNWRSAIFLPREGLSLAIPVRESLGLGPAAASFFTADEIHVVFDCRAAERKPLAGYEPMTGVLGAYRYDHATHAYEPLFTEIWIPELKVEFKHEGAPETLTVQALRDWRPRELARVGLAEDADIARIIGLAQTLVADGRATLDAERPRFLAGERDLRADEADKMRSHLAATDRRREDLDRELHDRFGDRRDAAAELEL